MAGMRTSLGSIVCLPCTWFFLLTTLLAADQRPAGANSPPAPLLGWETLARPDRLAEFKPSIEVGCVSSYDRTGGNDDGFSGKYSFVRRENDDCVIADLVGPGVIYRIWTPTPTDDWMDFYFDGEASPRVHVRFRELFLGGHEPFAKPLVGYGVGGFFCYVPLAYERSCKIVLRAKQVQFYQINYARYAPGTPLATFTPSSAASSPEAQAAREIWKRNGQDLSGFTTPSGQRAEVIRKTVHLAPGQTASLFSSKKPGRLVGLRLLPGSALAGKNRDILLRIAFDSETPSVLCPLGDFFGYAWGEPAMRSLFVGSNQREAYCYYPMPFDRTAKVELISERSQGEPLSLQAEVLFAPVPRQTNEGRFAATWRRENPTTTGRPFTFIENNARGHLVGFVLQAQGFESGKTLFFEGDDETWIDGQAAIHGTGSEDFLNGGWYDVPDRWEKRLSFPLSGCLGYQKHLGRTGGYRLLLGDAYSYRESIRQTIEHSGTGNDIPTDYAGVTYLYASQPPSTPLEPRPVSQRSVNDPTEVIFAAWWQIPIRAFPFQDATLTRQVFKLGNDEIRVLAMRAGAADWVGEPYLFVTCQVPSAGRYEIAIEAVRGPEQGVVQLYQDEVPAGEAIDLFAEAKSRTGRLKLGLLDLEEGDNPVMLKLVRKNAQAHAKGLDLISIVCTRLP